MKTAQENISVYSEETAEFKSRSALPGLQEIRDRVHSVSAEVLRENLSKTMSTIESMFESLNSSSTMAIKEVKVALAVNGGGEVSLLGLTKGKAELTATFEITFTPVRNLNNKE